MPDQPAPRPARQRVDTTAADMGTLVDLGVVEEPPEPAVTPPPEPPPDEPVPQPDDEQPDGEPDAA